MMLALAIVLTACANQNSGDETEAPATETTEAPATEETTQPETTEKEPAATTVEAPNSKEQLSNCVVDMQPLMANKLFHLSV